jgi:hypothetical protein
VNREERLRKVVPGAPPGLIAGLAARPAAEVDLIVALARQARRDAIAADKARRRQRVAAAEAALPPGMVNSATNVALLLGEIEASAENGE